MPLIGPWREDDFGTPAPDHVDDLQLFFAARSQTAVAEVELLAEGGAEDLRRVPRFAAADLHGSARSHLAVGELDDASLTSAAHDIHDRAAACQLDVIRMGSEKNRINGFGHHKLTILNAAASGSTSLTMQSTR